MFHTFFNVACTILFLPLCGWFVRVSRITSPRLLWRLEMGRSSASLLWADSRIR